VSDSITKLTDNLIASYAKVGGINHLDGGNLPSKFAIASITTDLLRLLLPGFFDEKPIQTSELKVEISMLMDSVSERLEDEIAKSIKYKHPGNISTTPPRQLARKITNEFLGTFPEIRKLLKTDVEAAYSGDPAAISHEEVVVAYPFIETIAVQRMAHQLYERDVTLIPRIMSEWAHSRTGIDLHPGAKIGSHFFIDHGTGTVVGETTIIGNNVKIYHGVTLGAKSTSRVEELRGSKRHPTIEDGVTIYPGATILGGETVIGSNSTIGGNVFLIHSVPPDSLAIAEDISVNITQKASQTEI
jgi:serine O-acetyltransferase|tara:strand:+ start:214 stop:1116 length:903 start_codon:yes stop_codon:yes gene_type:complete